MNRGRDNPHATPLILSGGSEIVGLAIAETLYKAGKDYRVASLVPRSILRGLPGCHEIVDLSAEAGKPERLRDALLDLVAGSSEESRGKSIIFATEDGGLRCLNEYSSEILPHAEFPRARNLRMGGLDKAELFEFLMKQPESSILPRTRILTEFRQAEDALRDLGDDAVFKPALKPWDMDLSNMGAKVVTRDSQLESRQSILRRLARAWPMSKRWVAQERLSNFADGEVGVWAARGERGAIFTEFAERWKYPVHGGSGCWVESRPHGAFFPLVDRLLERLDYIGLCEVPFLADDAGQPKLIELNSRAWLQVGLAEHSGLPVIEMTLSAMSGQEPPTITCTTEGTWINIERALQAALSGSRGPRLAALATLIRKTFGGANIAVWSSPFGMVRGRWIRRMIGKVLDRIRG